MGIDHCEHLKQSNVSKQEPIWAESVSLWARLSTNQCPAYTCSVLWMISIVLFSWSMQWVTPQHIYALCHGLENRVETGEIKSYSLQSCEYKIQANQKVLVNFHGCFYLNDNVDKTHLQFILTSDEKSFFQLSWKWGHEFNRKLWCPLLNEKTSALGVIKLIRAMWLVLPIILDMVRKNYTTVVWWH